MPEQNDYNTITSEYEDTWNFLNLIYETAHDPGFWPLALEGLKTELDSQKPQHKLHDHHSNNLILEENKSYKSTAVFDYSTVSDSEMALLKKLLPHFKLAFDIHRRYQSLKNKNDITNSFLDRLPLGIIFTDNQGKVITTNNSAKVLINEGQTFKICNGIIHTTDNNNTQKLLSHIDKAHQNSNSDKSDKLDKLQLLKPDEYSSVTVLITPHTNPDTVASQQQCVVLFIISEDIEFAINEKALISLFDLSITEAVITKHIASGKSITQYCETHGVTQNTVRKQLKFIFNKTNTHSQSELSNRILTSPAIFVTTKKQTLVTEKKITSHCFLDDKQIIQLPDGRSLCYADVGDKEGLPVVLCHGNYGCRLERFPDDKIVTDLGIRLIVPDRPGFGLSTARQSQHGLEWSLDFEFLLDHLNISKSYLLSTGSGSYFALACAHEKPERVSGVTLVNNMAPFKSIKEFSGMIPHEKIFFAMARHTPKLFKRFVELCYLGLSKNINWYFNSIKTYGGQGETAALSDDFISIFVKNRVFTAFEHSYTGFLQETILLANPWKINFSKIKTHIELYRGGKQVTIPFSMSLTLNSLLPDSSFHFLPEQGTHFLYIKWRSLFMSIKDLEQKN